MSKKFKKEDLKSNYVVELRNGDKYIVARVGRNFTKVLIGPDERWVYLSSYDDNLCMHTFNGSTGIRANKDADIMKIYGLVCHTHSYHLSTSRSTTGRELLWSRQQAVKLTVDEISKMLGYEVEIVGDSHHAE